ncbi:unnamed protein product [Prunus armeniaca]
MDVNVNELRDHVDRRERAQPAIGQRDLCHCWECAFSSSVIISCIPTSVMLPAPSDLHLSNTYVTGVVFVSAVATVVMLDCVSPRESCDTWWLMFCLYFNDGDNSNIGGSCWDLVLFSTLHRWKNYAWS